MYTYITNCLGIHNWHTLYGFYSVLGINSKTFLNIIKIFMCVTAVRCVFLEVRTKFWNVNVSFDFQRVDEGSSNGLCVKHVWVKQNFGRKTCRKNIKVRV
jgi:hypothetical protein